MIQIGWNKEKYQMYLNICHLGAVHILHQLLEELGKGFFLCFCAPVYFVQFLFLCFASNQYFSLSFGGFLPFCAPVFLCFANQYFSLSFEGFLPFCAPVARLSNLSGLSRGRAGAQVLIPGLLLPKLQPAFAKKIKTFWKSLIKVLPQFQKSAAGNIV